MTRAESRMIQAVAVLLASPLLYVVFFQIIDDSFHARDSVGLIWSDVLTCTIIGWAWSVFWRRSVNWTGDRQRRTVIVGLAGCVFAGITYLAVGGLDREVGAVLAGMAWMVAWVMGTSLVWRDTPEEARRRRCVKAGDPLSCPSCGYDMRGLHQATCPECGTQYTLDELLIAVTVERGRASERGHPRDGCPTP